MLHWACPMHGLLVYVADRFFFFNDGVKNLAVTSTLLQHMEWTVLYFKYSNV